MPHPREADGLAAGGRARVEDAERRFPFKERQGLPRRGVLDDERALAKAFDIRDANAVFKAFVGAVGEGEECLRRLVVPLREERGLLLAEAGDPAAVERARAALADIDGFLRQLSFQRLALAEKRAERRVDDAGDRLRAARLRRLDRLVDGGEIGDLRLVEDLRRADVEESLQLALRPRLQKFPQDEPQRTQPADHRVDEILHERAVGAVGDDLGGERARRQPPRHGERGLPPGIVNPAHSTTASASGGSL